MEARRFPFGGVPVYNPLSLSKDEALAQFHVRQAAYLSLMGLLREERPSHVLIIGTRGMGKTTLLQRVRYGVEDDAELNSRYLVLAFPEEQYNVNRLHRFLLNAVDAAADAIERFGNKQMLERIEKYVDVTGKRTPEEIEEQAPQFLADISRELQKGLLLLVDNADRLFEVIETRQQWRLRELLSSRRDLTFFGATTQASDAVYGPEGAFFEFFKIHRLTPLTFTEVRDLLLRLSESVKEDESEKGTAKRRVAEWLDADAARLRTLVQLTGGNPRTTVLLFHLVLDGLAGGAREYLERLLDQVTPGYKGRVDELPPQAQQVLDAVALRWDPVIATEVAEDTGLETTAVSSQLSRLVRQGILEKADPGDSKRALYQVAERFFNIWYLMRASRRVRAKLRWFVEFLRVFFESGELEQMAWERMERYKTTWRGHPEEIETTFAYMLASGAGRERFEGYLREKCGDIEEMWRPYLDLIECSARERKCVSDGPVDGRPGVGVDVTEAELRKALEAQPEEALNWRNLGRLLARRQGCAMEAEAAFRKATELRPRSAAAWAELGRFLGQSVERREEAERAIRAAIELEPCRGGSWYDLATILATSGMRVEAEASYRRAIELDPRVAAYWHDLGTFLETIPERAADAEMVYRDAIEANPGFAGFWSHLGALIGKVPERAAEAEAAYRKAIELEPCRARSWYDLATILATSEMRRVEAEASYRRAIELDRKVVTYWHDLGTFLETIPGRAADAEMVYRDAIEANPGFAGFWSHLGALVEKVPERAAEAEAAYRKAIELEPKVACFWNNLGGLLWKTPGRTADAETACRQAIALDPKSAAYWLNLVLLLAGRADQAAEAEMACRRAIELDPKVAEPWGSLGNLLASMPERAADAEAAYRKAIELDPKVAWFWNGLGNLLWSNLAGALERQPGRIEEVEAAYRGGIELDPKNVKLWGNLGVFLACRAGRPKDAEVAFRNSVRFGPNDPLYIRNLGVLLYCELAEREESAGYLRRAHQLNPADPVSAAIVAASLRDLESPHAEFQISTDASRQNGFWDELLGLCRNYAPFGKILVGICDLVQERDNSNRFVRLYRAVALAQLRDFPRASVALEDALTGDPLELLSIGQRALETFLAAAVKGNRVHDCIELIDKKDWKDAWRPFYEALRAVEEGSAEYLKRVAVEIRAPALTILRRIAPQIPNLTERSV